MQNVLWLMILMKCCELELMSRSLHFAPEPQKSFYNELKLPEQRVCVPLVVFSRFSWIKLLHAIRRLKPAMVITQLWYEHYREDRSAMLGYRFVLCLSKTCMTLLKQKMFLWIGCFKPFNKIIAVSQTVKNPLLPIPSKIEN